MANADRPARSLAEAIWRGRTEKSLSQEQLAETAEIDLATLQGIESGKRKPQFRTLKKISVTLDLPLEELSTILHQEKTESSKSGSKRLPNRLASEFGDADDLALVSHWSNLLRIFSRTQNTTGSMDLYDAVRHELVAINRRAREAGENQAAVLVAESHWSEFASWISADLGKPQDADMWLQRSIELARKAAHEPLTAYGLMRRAQQAAEYGDGPKAATFARKALSVPSISNRDIALCRVREAHGLALSGDSAGSLAAINDATRRVDAIDIYDLDGDPRTIGMHCNPAYVRAYWGLCQLHLQNKAGAIATLKEVVANWPRTYRHDEGLAHAWLAVAYAEDRQFDAAIFHGKEALAIAIEIGSRRILRVLGKVDSGLANHQHSSPEAIEFRAAYAAAQRCRL